MPSYQPPRRVTAPQPVVPDLKRGGFAVDKRTGQIVKVAEIGGRDVMVRTAYKSDGLWTDPANLRPLSKDPHPWGWTHLVRLLVVLGAASWSAYCAYSKMRGHGVPFDDSLIQAAVPTGLILLTVGWNLLGLNRP